MKKSLLDNFPLCPPPTPSPLKSAIFIFIVVSLSPSNTVGISTLNIPQQFERRFVPTFKGSSTVRNRWPINGKNSLTNPNLTLSAPQRCNAQRSDAQRKFFTTLSISLFLQRHRCDALPCFSASPVEIFYIAHIALRPLLPFFLSPQWFTVQNNKKFAKNYNAATLKTLTSLNKEVRPFFPKRQ